MKTLLIAVGKTVHQYLNEGINDYHRRINRYIPMEIMFTPDVKNTKNLSHTQQMDAEAELIMRLIQPGDYIVLLDEHGKEYTSEEFSRYIDNKKMTVGKRLVFIIGGPYGFGNTVKEIASEKISVSKMTFPHDMIRLIFIEQLYRAMTISAGEPYHHP